jgi:hypothetical protein
MVHALGFDVVTRFSFLIIARVIDVSFNYFISIKVFSLISFASRLTPASAIDRFSAVYFDSAKSRACRNIC